MFTEPAGSLEAGRDIGGRMKHKKKHRVSVHSHAHHGRHHHAHLTGQLMRGHGMSLAEASRMASQMKHHHKVADGSGFHPPGAGRGMHAPGVGRGMKHKKHHGHHHHGKRICGHCKGSGMKKSGKGPCGHCKGTGFWSDFATGFKKGFLGTAGILSGPVGALVGQPGLGAAIGGLANGLNS